MTDTTYTNDLNIASATSWGVLYANSGKSILNTGAGTSGYLLQSNASSAPSWIQATNSNTATTIVKRDSSGGFSAGIIQATALNINRTIVGTYISLSQNDIGVVSIALNTLGPANTEGWVSLTLGNNKAKSAANNASGKILLYHSDGAASTISAGFDSIATTTKAVKIDTGLSVTGDIESTDGFVYVRSGSIWAGTTASTTAERDVGVRAGSGNLYLYAGAATTGNRGLFCTNAAGTSTQVITINQDNQISGIMNLAQNAAVQKAGASVSWIDGRTTAIAKTTSYSGYNGVISMKTTNGDWSLGVYTGDAAYLTYITDANYDARNNATTGQIAFESAGNIYASGIIVSKGPGERWCEAQNSTYGNRLCLDVNANGQIAGIWSSGYVNSSGTYVAGAKWLIYRNVNNATVIGDTVYISGNAYIGSSGSYYFSSGGELAVSGNVRSGNPISFLTTSNTAQAIKAGGLVSSYTYTDNAGAGCLVLDRNTTNTAETSIYFYTQGGARAGFTFAGNKVAYSSREKKNNILPLKSFGEEIDKLNLVSFSYKWDPNDEITYGLIYEDTINILPYICFYNPDDIIDKGISYEKLIPIMLKEIQDLRKRVKELELSKN